MNEPRNRRGETFDEFVARKAGGKPKPINRPAREGLPPGWEDKSRKRASGPLPDFERDTEHALAYAEIHCQVWNPEMVDVRRLAGGRAALLIRGRRGTAVMLVMRGGEVLDVGTEEEFRARKEVVT